MSISMTGGCACGSIRYECTAKPSSSTSAIAGLASGRATAEGARNLSAGEARRILLARVALSEPRLMLLDEPDDALDADGPRLVERLVKQSDATTLIVTHNLALARRMDLLWFVEDGQILEAGTPAELLTGHGPAGRFFTPRSVASGET